MCYGGNVRSVSLAFILKYEHNQDAMACGHHSNSPETREMMYKWADYIIIMQAYMKEHVPAEYHSKLRVVDVGEDRFGYAQHLDLIKPLSKIVAQWKQREFKI
jgi:hypothetical protein